MYPCRINSFQMKVGLFIPCYVDAPILRWESHHISFSGLWRWMFTILWSSLVAVSRSLTEDSKRWLCPHAEHFEQIFNDYDYIVGPSASCAAFVRINYPELLHGKHECTSAGKIMDIVVFLHDVLKVKNIPGKFPHIVCIHNSCHGVRELGLSTPSERNEKPYSKIKALLEMVEAMVAVAEYGCVWVPQIMKERAVMFISQSLAIIVDRNDIVSNMHEAYSMIKIPDFGYGCFISGPSKTADVAQALVMGAQAAREVTVVII